MHVLSEDDDNSDHWWHSKMWQQAFVCTAYRNVIIRSLRKTSLLEYSRVHPSPYTQTRLNTYKNRINKQEICRRRRSRISLMSHYVNYLLNKKMMQNYSKIKVAFLREINLCKLVMAWIYWHYSLNYMN